MPPSQPKDVQPTGPRSSENTTCCELSATKLPERLAVVEQKTDRILGLLEGPETSCDTRQKSVPAGDLFYRMSVVERKTDRILHLLEKPKSLESQRPNPERDLLFRSGRSIETLQAASDHHLVASPDENALYCDVCVTNFTGELLKRQAVGTFRYPFQIGSTFSTKDVLPSRFRTLKEAVTRHFTSNKHLSALEKRAAEQGAEIARKGEAGTIGMRVWRTAFHVLRKSHSQSEFEELIVLQHRNGLDMGNINHSKKVMAKARDLFAEVMLSMLTKHISFQPCISLLADKVTICRRTVDITAVITVIPDALPGQMIQSFVIGAPVVKGHDGESLAEELQGTVSAIGVTSTEKLAAISTDGQYHHARVPEKLMKNITRDDPCAPSTPPCVPAVWDEAHLLNLAEDDARKKPTNVWVDGVIDRSSAITKRFSMGKGLEDLLKTEKRIGQKVLRPKTWSYTRFAPHAASVIRVFIHNTRAMVTVLKDRLEELDHWTGLAQQLQEDLRCLEGMLCCIVSYTMIGVCTYSVIANCHHLF